MRSLSIGPVTAPRCDTPIGCTGWVRADALWQGLSGNIRREIRKAEKQLQVRTDLGLDRFHEVWAKTFQRQGMERPDLGRLERLEAACGPRGASTTLFACD